MTADSLSQLRATTIAMEQTDKQIIARWRPVVGHETYYDVSDSGQVGSLVYRGKQGEFRRRKPKTLKGGDRCGYYKVSLRNYGKHRQECVHVLVLEAFCGPRPRGFEAAHENGDRKDNRLGNLAWKTKSENERDKTRHGTRPFRIPNSVVLGIRRDVSAGMLIAAAAKKYSVSYRYAWSMVNNVRRTCRASLLRKPK